MKTILVVDDQPEFRKDLADSLRDRGYDVREAATARGALEELSKRTPRLILLDFSLGDGNGLDLLRLLRGRALWKPIPVVFLTGMVRRDVVEEAAKLGVNDYLIKSSFSLEQLQDRIATRIGVPSDDSSHPDSSAPGLTEAPRVSVPHSRPIPVLDPSSFLRSVEMRALPGAAAEILSMSDSPHASLSDLEKILRRDPVLSARILSASQTAAFMRAAPTRTLEEALQVLGMTQVVRLVAASSVLRKEELESPWGADVHLLWSHSIACGFLSQRFHEPKQEAFGFLVGLLHELSELLAILHIGKDWESLRNKGEGAGWSTLTALSEGFKSPFQRIAREVLVRMKLPASLSAILRETYDEEEDSAFSKPSTRIVQAAHRLSSLVGRSGSTLALVGAVRDRDLTGLRSTQGLVEELPRLEKEIQIWEELTGLKPGAPPSRAESSKILYHRGEGYSEVDPLEAFLRRQSEVERVTDPEQMLAGDADLRVVLAEPGSTAWDQAGKLTGRVLVVHTAKAEGHPSRTVRTLRLPLSGAKLENILREAV